MPRVKATCNICKARIKNFKSERTIRYKASLVKVCPTCCRAQEIKKLYSGISLCDMCDSEAVERLYPLSNAENDHAGMCGSCHSKAVDARCPGLAYSRSSGFLLAPRIGDDFLREDSWTAEKQWPERVGFLSKVSGFFSRWTYTDPFDRESRKLLG
jgi:hypothetical protein